ncbi:helix-turn-helix transcriptional regulator [Candidatus Woesearchaeota archaeon]|nr:helix-turn-helix transcriptional regulator [Candidatus Woesearchaeota archaeon]
MDICVYYDEKSEKILDILPHAIDTKVKFIIEKMWTQVIPRKILIALSSEEQYNASKLKQIVGHSMSTIHDTLRKLEDAELILTEVIYEGNKQRMIRPQLLCVTKSPKYRAQLKRFFQGMWVDTGKTKLVLDFLNLNHKKFFTVEEISARTKIPVDEVELLLTNWDSQLTRGLSGFLKEVPFEKKVLYRGRNE